MDKGISIFSPLFCKIRSGMDIRAAKGRFVPSKKNWVHCKTKMELVDAQLDEKEEWAVDVGTYTQDTLSSKEKRL